MNRINRRWKSRKLGEDVNILIAIQPCGDHCSPDGLSRWMAAPGECPLLRPAERKTKHELVLFVRCASSLQGFDNITSIISTEKYKYELFTMIVCLSHASLLITLQSPSFIIIVSVLYLSYHNRFALILFHLFFSLIYFHQ